MTSPVPCEARGSTAKVRTARSRDPAQGGSDHLAELEAIIDLLEAIIDLGERSFIATGQALAEIRDSRLYLSVGARTFGAYVKDRFAMSRSRAYQLIDAAVLSTVVDVPNEAVARELAPLKDDHDAIREVWRYVGPRPTADRVHEAVAAYLGRRRERRVEARKTGQPVEPMTLDDLRATFREAEVAILAIGPVVGLRYGDDLGTLPDRMLKVAGRLLWFVSELTGWQVGLNVDRDGAEL